MESPPSDRGRSHLAVRIMACLGRDPARCAPRGRHDSTAGRSQDSPVWGPERRGLLLRSGPLFEHGPLTVAGRHLQPEGVGGW
jgi:hypothetical protein